MLVIVQSRKNLPISNAFPSRALCILRDDQQKARSTEIRVATAMQKLEEIMRCSINFQRFWHQPRNNFEHQKEDSASDTRG